MHSFLVFMWHLIIKRFLIKYKIVSKGPSLTQSPNVPRRREVIMIIFILAPLLILEGRCCTCKTYIIMHLLHTAHAKCTVCALIIDHAKSSLLLFKRLPSSSSCQCGNLSLFFLRWTGINFFFSICIADNDNSCLYQFILIFNFIRTGNLHEYRYWHKYTFRIFFLVLRSNCRRLI